jgi:hypothetical protein
VFLIAFSVTLNATPRKVHVVGLGAVRRVPYSKAGDPAGASTGENVLKIRPLVVDDLVKEWTSGESHDVTDRSFVVRRDLRINDELPGEKPVTTSTHWVWQPWGTPILCKEVPSFQGTGRIWLQSIPVIQLSFRV